MDRQDRIAGGLFGLLIGDALGVPYEFHPPDALPPLEQIDMQPPAGFRRSHPTVPPGTWSDDGALALALLDSLLTCDRLDLNDFALKIRSWYEQGAYTPDGIVFDAGVQTVKAIQALQQGLPPYRSGPAGESDNGNGSLMRVLPLALWHTGDDRALVADAHMQSLPTHGHLRAQICCALYCLWARYELVGDTDAWATATNRLREIYGNGQARIELETHIRPDDLSGGEGKGYVVDTLRSARWAVAQGHSYERVVQAAIRLGYDTDTTACVAGGIAGIRYGLSGIPERWRQQLRGQELAQALVTRLLHH
ncbi:ADP-ribosylglycohydrolase family protein [Chloroflexus sp.]|uniref:ADP-ribosylglycohydrolase family protein n=1 Tax=Chloroflexus sp. TaxID=1904827 RepID=UPI00298F2333|nr:ADP-ribosylglycohydrolase family protein [Chloroflexus sp.]MDW8402678.1 ADP-ribosylglycohydrolase family protein [Chloroflexus sp.]